MEEPDTEDPWKRKPSIKSARVPWRVKGIDNDLDTKKLFFPFVFSRAYTRTFPIIMQAAFWIAENSTNKSLPKYSKDLKNYEKTFPVLSISDNNSEKLSVLKPFKYTLKIHFSLNVMKEPIIKCGIWERLCKIPNLQPCKLTKISSINDDNRQ